MFESIESIVSYLLSKFITNAFIQRRNTIKEIAVINSTIVMMNLVFDASHPFVILWKGVLTYAISFSAHRLITTKK